MIKTPRIHRVRKGRHFVSLWLVAPALAFVLAFRFVPGVAGVAYSFTDWDGITPGQDWIGLSNYSQLWSVREMRVALIQTLQLGVGVAFFTNVIGLLMALGLNRAVKSRNLLKALFFLPVVMMPIASAYVWRYIFAPEGLVNSLLSSIGRPELRQSWLGNPKLALAAVLCAIVWHWSGLTMVIYLAALKGIPVELEEAALVDGASVFKRFRFVTLPMLAPAITTNVVLMLITGLRTFDQILAMTGGGPIYATETLSTQVWRRTFQYGQFGLASAVGVVLAAIVVTVSLTSMAILRGRERRMSLDHVA